MTLAVDRKSLIFDGGSALPHYHTTTLPHSHTCPSVLSYSASIRSIPNFALTSSRPFLPISVRCPLESDIISSIRAARSVALFGIDKNPFTPSCTTSLHPVFMGCDDGNFHRCSFQQAAWYSFMVERRKNKTICLPEKGPHIAGKSAIMNDRLFSASISIPILKWNPG